MSELSPNTESLEDQLARLNEQYWDAEDVLNAIRIARAAVMNLIKERSRNERGEIMQS